MRFDLDKMSSRISSRYGDGVGRALYRALLTTARALDAELARCESLRPREISNLRTTIVNAVPRENRSSVVGVLHDRMSALSDSPESTPNSLDFSIQSFVRRTSRDLFASANSSYDTEEDDVVNVDTDSSAESSIDSGNGSFNIKVVTTNGDGKDKEENTSSTAEDRIRQVGFSTLRYLNGRLAALEPIVYTTTSDATRHGIRITAMSHYEGSERRRHLFRYHVRMHNTSAMTVKLLSRSWTIRDVDGRVTYVDGPGVVGAFPTLRPESSYEYSSAAPLLAPVGTQSGHYVFVVVPDALDNEEDMGDLDNDGDAGTDADADADADIVDVKGSKHEDHDGHIHAGSKPFQADNSLSMEAVLSPNGGMLHVPVAPFGLRAPTMRTRTIDGPGESSTTTASPTSRLTRRKKRGDEWRRR